MSQPLTEGTRVRYHGSIKYLHGAEFTVFNPKAEDLDGGHPAASEDGYRYILLPVVPGTVNRRDFDDYIYSVRRQSFAVLDEPVAESDCGV